MNKSSAFILSLILLAGGYLVWDLSAEKQKKIEIEKGHQIVPFPLEQIQKFAIHNRNQKIEIERTIQGWDLVLPLKDQADLEEVESYISAAASDKAIEIVEEGSQIQWERYGLAQPQLAVEFTNNLGHSRKVWVSDQVNFEGNSYIRLNQEQRVLTANSSWYSKSQKTALDFREKRFLRRKMAGIDQVEIQNQKGRWILKNENGSWQVVGHESWILNQERVREILKDFAVSQGLDIVHDEQSGNISDRILRDFGLQQPILTLNAKFENETWSLRLGQKSKEEIYVWTSNPLRIFRVDLNTLKNLTTLRPSDLRDKNLPFKVSPGTVEKILIQTQLKKTVLIRQQNQWTYENQNKKANQQVVDEFIKQLSQSQALDYLGSPQGLKSMTNRIQLLGDKDQNLLEIQWEPRGAGVKFKAYSSSFGETFYWSSGEIEKLKLLELLNPHQQEI